MSLKFASKPGAGKLTVESVNYGRGLFAVFSDNSRVSCMFRSRHDAQVKCAELQAEHDARSKRGRRACLCCGASFQSAGIHNRMCDGCRKGSDALGLPNSFSFGSANGRRKA